MVVSSFDIFDTCLVRKCGEPRNVLDLLADRAFKQTVSTEEKRNFVTARLEADARTWSAKQKLTDIYGAFAMKHPALLSKDELLKLEQTIEREMLVTVPEMVERIAKLRKAGHHIIFISDMYIGADFLRPILTEYGLLQEGDSLYVSCDVGATKASGELFAYVKKQEHIQGEWYHYGDNEISDVRVPKKLGIHVQKVAYSYTPYQMAMREKASLHFQWGSMLAGLSRSIALQSERTAHKDFVLDIIAPLFASFVCRVMKDALERGIRNLYFCARDTYSMYRIAQRMESLYGDVKVHYLYISRKSLYEGVDENKIGYYRQIGLAAKKEGNAIVDIRSTGRTLKVLNTLLEKNGYKQVFGYFFESCSNSVGERDGLHYYAELDDMYIRQMSGALRKVPSNWYLYELFFPLNTQKKTIGYKLKGSEYEPIFEAEDNKEYRLEGLKELADWREWAFDVYTEYFVTMRLDRYADEIFAQYVIPLIAEFFLSPNKHYLKALNEFWGLDPEKGYIRYVDKSIWRLPMNVIKRRTMWKRGTVFYSLPTWLSKWLYKRK